MILFLNYFIYECESWIVLKKTEDTDIILNGQVCFRMKPGNIH